MKRPQIMGILNVTPDSFSGDGMHTRDAALARFAQLVEEGADIVDIGAESTRPGATMLTQDAEWARLEPVLVALAAHPLRQRVRLSVDTYHAATAARALAMGVEIINDVSGLRDDAMGATVKHAPQLLVMHALSIPADPAVILPAETDMVQEILRWKDDVTRRAAGFGIAAERLVYDPGLGFGKTAEQSMALLLHTGSLVASGGCWLIGHSRKSLFSLVSPLQGEARDDLTLMASAMLAQAGAQILRVHHVARHRALMDRLCM